MKYKTAFRLALRAIGVLIVSENIPWFVQAVTPLLLQAVSGGGSGFGLPSEFAFAGGLAHSSGILIGLYLFFSGSWIVDRAIPSNRPYCHECAYELTGAPAEGLCPECGTAFRRPEIASRPAPPE